MLSLAVEKTSDRLESCYQLVRTLDGFSNDLMKNLERFIALEDSSGVGTIWTCCVTCLAHLAALCHLIGQTEPPLSGPMGDLCNMALERLGNLSNEVRIEEYSYLDVFTGARILVTLIRMGETLTKDAHQMSWKRALDTIDARIGLRCHAESEPLRHWRGVIGKAYADFQTNFSGYEPTTLASLVPLADGRTEGSSYPNLILHTERARYGL